MLEYFDNNRDTFFFFEKNNRDTVDHDFIYLFIYTAMGYCDFKIP